jgi:hypothetical protein
MFLPLVVCAKRVGVIHLATVRRALGANARRRVTSLRFPTLLRGHITERSEHLAR